MSTSWLTAKTKGRPVGVDRDAKALRGFVVAQEGPFKSGRGEFDSRSLREIAKLMRREAKGLKSRFTHPDLSNDGLGKHLGRARDPFIESIDTPDGPREAVRADLYFADSAFRTPSGDLAGYVMDLASEDPDAISSSLVIEPNEEHRLNKDGTPKLDGEGVPLPPLWRPVRLHASDIVNDGDAVDGLLAAKLSSDGLPDDVVRQAAALLKRQFAGRDRDFVEPRLRGWVSAVLDHYWPSEERAGEPNLLADMERRLAVIELKLLQT